MNHMSVTVNDRSIKNERAHKRSVRKFLFNRYISVSRGVHTHNNSVNYNSDYKGVVAGFNI